MKLSVFATLLYILLLLSGCQRTEPGNSSPPSTTDINTEPQPESDTKDRYLADVSRFLDDMIEVVESVSDEGTAGVALEELSKLEPRANALGKRVEELKAAEASVGSEDVVEYLQQNGKTRLASAFKKLEEKLGKSKATSKYPELWDSAVGLINKAKNN